ncbi:hypothetical protein MMC13_003410 [Lambiella insularis]|nr:hypothetical protein [Lambiella insularis]
MANGQLDVTADELLHSRAEANGYKRGAHKEADEVRGSEKHVTKTKKDQEATLRRYVLWHLGAIKNDLARRGLTPPSEDHVRHEFLRPGIAAPDLATVKDFLRFYIATSRPRLDVDKPTVDSMNTVAEWFFAGFTRVTGTETEEEDRSEVYNIRRTLTREGIVVNKHRPKHNFTSKDLTRVLLALWTRDDLIFIPERYRTGARLGAFFTNGLRYNDIELVLQRVRGEEWRLIYRIDQRWVKNNRDPDNIVKANDADDAGTSFRAAAKEHKCLFYNDAGFLLAIAIADGALFGYDTLDDIRRQQIPSGENELLLRFKDSSLSQPMLRKCTKTGGVTHEPIPKSSFTSIFKSAMTNAGYFCGLSIHAIRRQLGKGIDKRYTTVQRSQHLTQGDPRVFGQSYVANCSSVDGQAVFRDEESDHRHIEFFQSLEKFHEEGLPDKLPSHLEEDINRDPDLSEFEKKIQTLASSRLDDPALRKARQHHANHLKKLKLNALRQYQTHWVRERRDWKILTRGRAAAPDKGRTEFVQNICLLIPERGRLAQTMATDQVSTPDEIWHALQDVYNLCRHDFTVVYLPGSRPVDGACPVKCCQLRIDSLPKFQRNQHLQTCIRWDMANRLGRLQTEIHYCYLCFNWVVGEEWEPHCCEHLAEIRTGQCGTITYCHTLVRPGYCPFCLNNTTLPPSKRLESWTRDHKLWSHVDDHLRTCRWPHICPHITCDTLLKDTTALQFHLVDDHGLGRARPGKGAKSTTLDGPDKKIPSDTAVKGSGPKGKRTFLSNKRVLDWMPTQNLHDSPGSSEKPTRHRPFKPARQPPQTVCPLIISRDECVYNAQEPPNIVNTVMLPGPYSPNIGADERTATPANNPFSSCSPSIYETVAAPIPEFDDGSTWNDVDFNQFLYSPSPSPSPSSPEHVPSKLSGATLIDAEPDQSRGRVDRFTETFETSETSTLEDAPNGEEARDR